MQTSPGEIRRKRRASGASIISSFSLGGWCGYIGNGSHLTCAHIRAETSDRPIRRAGRDVTRGKMGAGECDVLEGEGKKKWGRLERWRGVSIT